jgi:hypothetical protein
MKMFFCDNGLVALEEASKVTKKAVIARVNL